MTLLLPVHLRRVPTSHHMQRPPLHRGYPDVPTGYYREQVVRNCQRETFIVFTHTCAFSRGLCQMVAAWCQPQSMPQRPLPRLPL